MSKIFILCFSISSESESRANIPPKIKGCKVFTRPPIISGKFVTSSTGITFTPFSLIAFEVPPVETISTPKLSSSVAKSVSLLLSLTLIRTRDTCLLSILI